jgi:ASTRA-associated protein 1
LIVWKLSEKDEAGMSTSLPIEEPAEPRPLPWMVHLLEVNTMNFCAFSSCAPILVEEDSQELLIAVPDTLVSEAVRAALKHSLS